jgi:hypothetical protein
VNVSDALSLKNTCTAAQRFISFFSPFHLLYASFLSSNVSSTTNLDASAMPVASFFTGSFVCALSRGCHFFIIGKRSHFVKPARRVFVLLWLACTITKAHRP